MAAFIFAMNKGSFLSDSYNKTLMMGVICSAVIIMIIFYLYTYLTSTSLLMFEYLIRILVFFIVLLGLAIFYKMFANNLIKVGGKSKFIILLIFYIPCLFSDAIQFIKDQLHVTPNITYILLILEIILIVAYFVLPRFFSLPLINGGIELQKGKIFLDTQKILIVADAKLINILAPSSSNLLGKDINENDPSRKEFSLSMWLYINAPEMSDISFPIICYGNSDISGKPLMTYVYDQELNTFVLNITFSNSKDKIKSIKIVVPNQKWNNLVFNYQGTNADLFINGILERSVNLSNNMPTFSVSDTITVGSNTNGINGAISDIVYFTQPLSALQILGSYHLGINTIAL